MNRSKLTTRTILAAAALLCSASTFAKAELDFWSWRQEDAKAYNEIIAAFEKSNPDISINYTAHEAKSYATVLTTALTGGAGPDIIHTRAYGAFESVAAPGYLEPLNGKVDLSGFSKDELLGVTLRSDGKVYSVPMASQTILVYYNADLLAAQKITPPTTWDEFVAAAKKLKSSGIMPLANGTKDGWTVEVMSGAFMPNFYGESFFGEVTAGSTDFEDARYVGAMEKFGELREFLPQGHEGVDYATMKQLFTSGAAAMFVGGSWEIAGFRKAGVNFDIMPGPAAKAGGSQMVATWLDGGYAVNSGSENKEAALKFARFLATQEFGQMLTDKLANVAAVDGAVSSDPMLAKISEFHGSATPYIMLVGYRFKKPTGSTLLQNGLQELMAGKKSAAAVAKEVSDGIKASK
ncbi:putative ABC-type sugar transport system,periplasmic component [Vibrio nigripulchritudo SO65]|uniref:extracellular solute-binding protein n=1 Tax=Vibrio nigripulchritudo TaxID=28173 RepID=UPI0003B18C8F|nr:extracellular solute-binding protein [Vibrio nigripulchritudo]CCN33895.1 putative ABC-type sugar transport system,periplasmic component [Vibrio nigripulchritudo AM115]CCN43785.1 putative ABC-type sugar transport system,periplasmic component [Vibrio nigripulchritudo FTn2]CCN65177.1 putative ABC-type sugar transport system,periplasmic component [Vibrio nigripulchritudo POn4]CCN78980.1 putative ABC-type sugar transport system,periplasmic component [Vibrio nigripulchritudo SO65]